MWFGCTDLPQRSELLILIVFDKEYLSTLPPVTEVCVCVRVRAALHCSSLLKSALTGTQNYTTINKY